MKTFTGMVISKKMEKTVTVRIKRIYAHPLYGKEICRHKNIKAHYENLDLNEGDNVVIVETRPISKEKHYKVTKIVKP